MLMFFMDEIRGCAAVIASAIEHVAGFMAIIQWHLRAKYKARKLNASALRSIRTAWVYVTERTFYNAFWEFAIARIVTNELRRVTDEYVDVVDTGSYEAFDEMEDLHKQLAEALEGKIILDSTIDKDFEELRKPLPTRAGAAEHIERDIDESLAEAKSAKTIRGSRAKNMRARGGKL